MAVPKRDQKYGAYWDRGLHPAEIELECVSRDGQWTSSNGTVCGMGMVYHVMAFAKMAWPWIKWHRWNTDLILPTLCSASRVAIHGPSNAGKSFMAAVFSLILYFARPNETTVLVSSTTRDELELRVWGEMKMLWKRARETMPWLPGNLTDSKQLITTDGKEVEGRDVRNGVVGRPCKRSNTWDVVSPFVGIKNKYVIAIGDEAGVMPSGFLKAYANLMANPFFLGIVLGNLGDLDTPLGEAAEPKNGWDSLPDFEVSHVYDTRWCNGKAIQLIGQDSPQLDYPEDEEPFAPLIGRRYLRECAESYGLGTPLYNMFAAGKIPRGTMENRVITKQMCLKFHAFEPVEWGHKPITKLYGADISYSGDHGDRTVGLPLAFGEDVTGKLRLAPLERPLIYTPSDRATGSIEEQIATQMRAECERLGIPPEHVFYDGTGRSSFTAAVMRLWSTSVVPVEFGGTASQRPNFMGRKYAEDRNGKRKGDLLPCDEVLQWLVTELWFAVGYLISSDQMRGLTEEVAKEGYTRTWRIVPGNKQRVETKAEMKLRLGRSPDIFESLVCGAEGARRLGFPLGTIGVQRPQNRTWMRSMNRSYEEAIKSQELDVAA